MLLHGARAPGPALPPPASRPFPRSRWGGCPPAKRSPASSSGQRYSGSRPTPQAPGQALRAPRAPAGGQPRSAQEDPPAQASGQYRSTLLPRKIASAPPLPASSLCLRRAQAHRGLPHRGQSATRPLPPPPLAARPCSPAASSPLATPTWTTALFPEFSNGHRALSRVFKRRRSGAAASSDGPAPGPGQMPLPQQRLLSRAGHRPGLVPRPCGPWRGPQRLRAGSPHLAQGRSDLAPLHRRSRALRGSGS